MPAGPALPNRTVTAALIAAGVLAAATALFAPSWQHDDGGRLAPLAEPLIEDMPAHFQRAMQAWQGGDVARARQEFGHLIRLKRRAAELKVEEL
jgi:hypothetical protein